MNPRAPSTFVALRVAAGLALLAFTTHAAEPGLLCKASDGERSVEFTMPVLRFQLEPGESIHPQLGTRFTAEWNGRFKVLEAGSYTLRGRGARIEVNGVEAEGRPVRLGAGEARLRVTFERMGGPAALRLEWESDQFTLEPMPAALFTHPTDPPSVARERQRTWGRELVESLGCVSCHASSGTLVTPRGAPDLSEAGQRLEPGWLTRWMDDPPATRADASMPVMLHGPGEVADVVAYLATLRPSQPPSPLKGPPAGRVPPAEAGGDLFRKVGCAACHGNEGIPLNGIATKFQPGELARYLLRPLHGRPGGRMPEMGLTQEEAVMMAAFLATQTNALRPAAVRAGDASRGRELMAARGCGACHALRDARGGLAGTLRARPMEQLPAEARGCLATSRGGPGSPFYPLTADDREAILSYLKSPDRSPAPIVDAPRWISRYRCNACHEFHQPAAFAAVATQAPPALNEVGSRLRPGAIGRVLHQRLRVRPWLELRMPHYGEGTLAALVRGFPSLAGLASGDEPAPRTPADLDKARRGSRLIGIGDGGLSCITCHDCLGDRSQGDLRGPDLAGMHERLRPEWIGRWLHDPGRWVPGTAMPAFFSALPAAEADERISEIMAALSAGRNMPPPQGLRTEARDCFLTVGAKPIVLRGFLVDSSPRSIAVGLPGGLSYCFDADACRWRYAWSGEFLDMRPTWQGRGAGSPIPRGTRFFTAPEGDPWRVLADPAAEPARFLDYATTGGSPVLHYRVHGLEVWEQAEPAASGGLRVHYRVKGDVAAVSFKAPAGGTVLMGGQATPADGDGWTPLAAGTPREFDLLIPGPLSGKLSTNTH